MSDDFTFNRTTVECKVGAVVLNNREEIPLIELQ